MARLPVSISPHLARVPRVVPALLLLLAEIVVAEDAATQPGVAPVHAERLAAEAEFRQCLRRPISVDVDGEPLERALARVSLQTTVPINVDWEKLDAVGLRKVCPISLRLQNVPADRALALILRCATSERGSSGPRVQVDADGAHLRCETDEDRTVEVIAYDVRDLIRADQFGGRPAEQCFEDLIRLVQENVATETWMEVGGSMGRIRVAPAHPAPRANPDDPEESGGGDPGDPLVVMTTPEIQAQLADLLARLRAGMAGLPSARPVAVARTAKALARPIPATFRLLPLESVLDSIGRRANVNLYPDWQILTKYGIDRDTLVTTPVPPKGMLPAGEALSAVIAAVAKDHAEMRFEIDADGIVEVFPASEPPEQAFPVCCYNIGALLRKRAPARLWPADASVDDRADAICHLVETEVAPDTWLEAGGMIGRIRSFGCVLVVTQTQVNQEKVAMVLSRVQ